MKTFAVRTILHAPPESIWRVLTDAAGFPAWNTTVTRIDGRIALDEKITVHVRGSTGRAFPVKVTVFNAPQRMVWTGGMPLGLFKGERVFELRSLSLGNVEFFMREAYSGLLAPLITKSIPDLQPAFDEFAACLKARAESLRP